MRGPGVHEGRFGRCIIESFALTLCANVRDILLRVLERRN